MNRVVATNAKNTSTVPVVFFLYAQKSSNFSKRPYFDPARRQATNTKNFAATSAAAACCCYCCCDQTCFRFALPINQPFVTKMPVGPAPRRPFPILTPHRIPPRPHHIFRVTTTRKVTARASGGPVAWPGRRGKRSTVSRAGPRI